MKHELGIASENLIFTTCQFYSQDKSGKIVFNFFLFSMRVFFRKNMGQVCDFFIFPSCIFPITFHRSNARKNSIEQVLSKIFCKNTNCLSTRVKNNYDSSKDNKFSLSKQKFNLLRVPIARVSFMNSKFWENHYEIIISECVLASVDFDQTKYGFNFKFVIIQINISYFNKIQNQ